MASVNNRCDKQVTTPMTLKIIYSHFFFTLPGRETSGRKQISDRRRSLDTNISDLRRSLDTRISDRRPSLDTRWHLPERLDPHALVLIGPRMYSQVFQKIQAFKVHILYIFHHSHRQYSSLSDTMTVPKRGPAECAERLNKWMSDWLTNLRARQYHPACRPKAEEQEELQKTATEPHHGRIIKKLEN